jgi:predicted AlkP superfamily phosphohydrolase/phosphomutase
MRKIVVMGLDGFSPKAVRHWLADLPQLKKIHQEGIWGSVECIVPPTAPQAWISSQCGQNPGAYGLWGYNYRNDFYYGESEIANFRVMDDRADCLYKTLPRVGQKVAVINAPLTWSPPEIPGGYSISDFMHDGNEAGFTWPKSLQQEVCNLVGDYIFDPFDTIRDSGPMNRKRTVERIREMVEQRFTLVRHFIRKKNCDYVFAVMTGIKFIHKLFCNGLKPNHSGSYYEDVIRDYYKWIDTKVGEIHRSLDSDTGLFVYSPYSIQRRTGQLNLNEWFNHNGYMTLYEYPGTPTAFANLNVDWAKTRCWSIGNSGKIYINLKGRETQGIVEPDDYDELLDELRDRLSGIQDKGNRALGVQLLKREEINFGKYEEYGPDMFMHIHEAPWNTNDRVGYGLGQIFAPDQQEDFDGEYNGVYGYFAISGSDVPAIGELSDVSLLSIAPTVMEALRMEIPAHMEKPSILSMAEQTKKESSANRKARVRSRLKALGY